MEIRDYRNITLRGVYDYITEEGAVEIEAAIKYFESFKSNLVTARILKEEGKESDEPRYLDGARRHLACARQSYKSYRKCMKKIHQLFGKDINWRIDWYKAHGEIPTAAYLYNLPVSKEDTEAWLNR